MTTTVGVAEEEGASGTVKLETFWTPAPEKHVLRLPVSPTPVRPGAVKALDVRDARRT